MSNYHITITRDGDGPIRYEPDAIDVTIPVEAGLHFRLVVPVGWTATVDPPSTWRVTPVEPNLDQPANYTIVSVPDGTTVQSGTIQVDLDLRSSFDPARYALPLRNRASELGEVNPRHDIFERTVKLLPKRLKRLLFRGLYSDIVFLHAEGKHRGGMCSGMARWAVARGLGQEPAPPSTEAAVERIQLYHGRQLRDRALLSAVPWFLRGSPKAAYQAVRHDLLREGITDRALDIAVPKLWRLDLAQALVAEGHTVVPYRLRQFGAERAELEVYDPNHPAAIGSDEPRTITFDLARNRYAYGKLVEPEQTNVGIIAVRQKAYAQPGTAFLATLGSFVFAPRRGWRALVGAYEDART
ncbi:MAG TPA: hypothetical protein VEX37_16460 [Thermomicrobiales bacterium]|nr:hypothetical protein [Thermomicrobiales bacterium]